MVKAEADIGVGCEVKHDLDAPHRRAERPGFEHVAANLAEPPVRRGVLDERLMPR